MAKINVTVRLDTDRIASLDELARLDDRDRSYVIKEAVDSYIRLRRWQIEEIRKALAEAEAGDFAPEGEVETLFAAWSR